MQVDVIGLDGNTAGKVNLEEGVFSVKISSGSVYHKMRNELANKRQGTVKTKDRSEVSFSGRKPWKQKGTGRARAGTRRSPIWVGGGTIFGPTPRDYSYTLPRKIKRLAFRSLLTEKQEGKILKVIENITSTDGTTKKLSASFAKINPDTETTVLVVKNHDQLLKRAAKNIPWLTVFVYSQLKLKELFYAKRIFVTKDAIGELNMFLLDNKIKKEGSHVS